GASLDVVKAYIENQRKPPSEKQIKQSLTLSAKGDCLLDPPLKETWLRKHFAQGQWQCIFNDYLVWLHIRSSAIN
ncbi:hypothetical protein EBS02_10690, partial [bacterium]|nr:hypothetical protein [bacterium]